jgi:hypothetical protein
MTPERLQLALECVQAQRTAHWGLVAELLAYIAELVSEVEALRREPQPSCPDLGTAGEPRIGDVFGLRRRRPA